MFNLLSRPWTEDPEFSLIACETGLRVFRGALEGSDDLTGWAETFARMSEERAEALHARVRDYIRAEDGPAPVLRAETAQLDRDSHIARDIERQSHSASGRLGAHEAALCAAHLANTHVLRLALMKTPKDDASHDALSRLHGQAVSLSETLIDLAANPDPSRERVARATIESLL